MAVISSSRTHRLRLFESLPAKPHVLVQHAGQPTGPSRETPTPSTRFVTAADTDMPANATSAVPEARVEPFSLGVPTDANSAVFSTLRELYNELVQTHYPGYEPKGDVELFALGSGLILASQVPRLIVPMATPYSGPPTQTTRQLCTQIVRSRHPGYQPQNDFELFMLGTGDFRDVQTEQLSLRLAQEWSQFTIVQGNDPAQAMASITTLLQEQAEVTGVGRRLSFCRLSLTITFS